MLQNTNVIIFNQHNHCAVDPLSYFLDIKTHYNLIWETLMRFISCMKTMWVKRIKIFSGNEVNH